MAEANLFPAGPARSGRNGLAQPPQPALAARRAALAGCALFKALRPEELETILIHAIPRLVERNATIMRRGDPSTGMAIILTGRVRIGLTAENGRDVTLAVLGPQEVIGEMSLLDGEPCSADATALEECVLLTVDRGGFLSLLRSNTDLCLRLLAVLCGRLRRSNNAVEDLASLDLPARLGRLLARLARDYGVEGASGTRIGVRLSQKDLGALVGGSREKVNRQLRLWEEGEVLRRDGDGHLVILHPEALEAAA